ncbi:hypothetical protein [Sulfurimonas sp.]|uniref:hypothetical protein n=1 Tax=Sulfurimonas sp. TaxID=2022749 RepID=UPI003D0F2A2A
MSSILKKLKTTKSTSCIIKAGVAVLFETQEQFNKLALASNGQYQEDSIMIDGIYVAFSDEIGAINIVPFSDISEDGEAEAFEHKNLKPVDFDKWFKRLK